MKKLKNLKSKINWINLLHKQQSSRRSLIKNSNLTHKKKQDVEGTPKL